MPYIKREDYVRASDDPKAPGELNFAITLRAIEVFTNDKTVAWFTEEVDRLVERFMENNGISYTNYNAASGALVCCGMELSRRADGGPYEDTASKLRLAISQVFGRIYHDEVAPYEDKKIKENGDVFPEGFF